MKEKLPAVEVAVCHAANAMVGRKHIRGEVLRCVVDQRTGAEIPARALRAIGKIHQHLAYAFLLGLPIIALGAAIDIDHAIARFAYFLQVVGKAIAHIINNYSGQFFGTGYIFQYNIIAIYRLGSEAFTLRIGLSRISACQVISLLIVYI